MNKKKHRLLHGSSGFSMAEMLLAMLILMMASAILAQGVPLAVDIYEKIVDSANAQVLLSTTMVRLRDEIGLTTEIISHNKYEVELKTANYPFNIIIRQPQSEEQYKMIQIEYKSDPLYSADLISPEAATNGLIVCFDEISVDTSDSGDVVKSVKIENLQVVKEGRDTPYCTSDLVIRMLARPKLK